MAARRVGEVPELLSVKYIMRFCPVGLIGTRKDVAALTSRILLPVCCLFRTSNIGSQPLYRFGEEPGKPLKTLMFGSC